MSGGSHRIARYPDRFGDLRRGLGLFRRFMGNRRIYVAGNAFLLLEALTAIVEAFPIAYLIDFLTGKRGTLRDLGLPHVIASERMETILLLTAAIILIAAFNKAADSCAEVCMARGGRALGYNVRVALYSHLQRLSLAYHDRKRTGDVLTRVTGDVLVLEEFVVGSVANIIASLMLLVGTLGVLLYKSWNVALVALVIVPVLATVSNYYSRRIKAASKSQRSSEGDLASTAQEMLTAIRLVQSYGRSSVDLEVFSEQTERSMRASLRAANIQAQFSFVVAVLEALAISAVVWVGVWLVDRDAITVGTLVLFIYLLQNMFKPARKIVSEWYKIGKVLASTERIQDLLGREAAVVESPLAVRAPALEGRLTFRNVCFAYPAEHEDGSLAVPRPRALTDVDFEVAPGEVVALAGPSGAGKSTIAQLVPRLYDPDHGAVLVDGLDVRSLTLESLRGQVSLVLQDTVLLSGTVAENIGYGVVDATSDRLEEAARAANAHEFIERLPDGYQTLLGERGANLSGGQRQRLAIARAFIRQTPILVLDEPTTGLDAESSRLVVEALRTLMRGKTTIVVSHDPSLVQSADRVLVIADGRIVEAGTHGRLLAQDGAYAELQAHPLEVAAAANGHGTANGHGAANGYGAQRAAVLVHAPADQVPTVGRQAGSGGAPSGGGTGAGPAPRLADVLAHRLPGLRATIDDETALAYVGQLLRPGAEHHVESLGVGGFWYRPDGTCTLQYDVLLADRNGRTRHQLLLGRVCPDGDGTADAAGQVLPLARAAAAADPASPWREWAVTVPRSGLILHAFPVEPSRPTLVHAADPSTMTDVLGRHLPGVGGARGLGRCAVHVVHHPREGACVLRYDLRPGAAGRGELRHETVYGKVYPHAQAAAVAGLLRSLHSAAGATGQGQRGLCLPKVLGYVPSLQMVLTDALPGTPVLPQLLRSTLMPTTTDVAAGAQRQLRAVVSGAARALAALHRTAPVDVPVRTLADLSVALRREHEVVAGVWPEAARDLRSRLNELVDIGSGTPVGPPVLSHGDFTPSQLLVDGDRPALVDLESACLAEPALDLGRFLAQLHAAGVKAAGDRAWPLLDELTALFVKTYGEEMWPVLAMDHQMLERVAAFRVTSLTLSGLRACRQLKDDRLALYLGMLRQGNDWTGRVPT